MIEQNRFRDILLIGSVLLFLTVCYLLTSPPGLTAQHGGVDGGELLVASSQLGVAHPPGYAIQSAVGYLFIHAPLPGSPIDQFRLWSYVLALTTCLMTGITACWVVSDARPAERLIAACVAAGMLGVSFTFWSQAIIIEVYLLAVFLFALLLLLIIRVQPEPASTAWRWAGAAGFVWGVSIGHHLSAILWGLGFAVLWSTKRRTGQSWLQTWGAGLLGLVGGVLLSLLLLLLLAGHAPEANWGAVNQSPHALWNHITGSQYHYFLATPSLQRLGTGLVDWARTTIHDFTVPGMVFSVIGWGVIIRSRPRLFVSMVLWSLPLIVFTALYTARDTQTTYTLPLALPVAVGVGVGVAHTTQRLPHPAWAAIVGAALILGTAIWHYGAVDISDDREAEIFLRSVTENLPSRTIILTDNDQDTFTLWYHVFVEEPSTSRMVIDRRMLTFDWYQDNLRSLYPALKSVPDLSVERIIRDPALLDYTIASHEFIFPAGGRAGARSGDWYMLRPAHTD